jgi:hypothetical protein
MSGKNSEEGDITLDETTVSYLHPYLQTIRLEKFYNTFSIHKLLGKYGS